MLLQPRCMELDLLKRLAKLSYGSVASLPSPSSNIEAWPYGTSLRFALLLHLGYYGYVNIADYVIILTKSHTCLQLSEFCYLKIRYVLHYVCMTFPAQTKGPVWHHLAKSKVFYEDQHLKNIIKRVRGDIV